MDTRYINYFLEIAKHKNLSKAASYLFVTQSSLSQYLSREESELGVKLFIRDKKELKLTYAGELYKQACEEMLKSKDRLYRSLSDLEQSKTGITRLGITPQWGGLVLSRILPKYTEKYPFNYLNLTEDIAHPLIEGISSNALDLALIALNEDAPSDYPNISIHREELILAVPSSFIECSQTFHDQGNIPVINLSLLSERPFIISKERTIIRDITNAMFRSAKFTPHVLCELNNHIATLEMVAQGLGITVIPKCYMTENKNIQYCSIAPHWYWNISVVMRRNYELSKADMYLIDLLKQYYEESHE